MPHFCSFFFFNDPATTEIYTLSLHDALPICTGLIEGAITDGYLPSTADTSNAWVQLFMKIHDQYDKSAPFDGNVERSEEHTSELQSPCNLVCRLLLEKKKYTAPVRETALSTC